MDRPNILVLTIGRTGSTILTRMLGQLGWNLPGIDEYAENVRFRSLNERFLRPLKCQGQSCRIRADKIYSSLTSDFLKTLESPWVLKDPRTVFAWKHWKDVLPPETMLLWLTRNHSDVEASLEKQGWCERGDAGQPMLRARSLDDIDQMCREILEDWPGPTLHLDYSHLHSAINLFDLERGIKSGPSTVKSIT